MSNKQRYHNNKRKFNQGKRFGNKFPKQNPDNYPEQLCEKEVGITEYISKLDGISGIIKARFSDFQVNEIDLNGEIAKLTSSSIPEEFKAAQTVEIDYEDIVDSPNPLIPQEKWDEIKDVLRNDKDDVVSFELIGNSKEERTEMHTKLKEIFGGKVVVSTVNRDNKKFIEMKKFNKKDKQDKRLVWPEGVGEYVHFLVYKECLDTMEACLKISSALHIPASNFHYAGVKDRRAKTTQWFSVRKVHPAKLLQRTRNIHNITIGNFQFKNNPLKLGDLSGNRFRIALKNIVAEDDLIKNAVKSLQANGFINYYGLQRFGHNKEIPTYRIGIQLLLGNWKEAVELILSPQKGDDPRLDITEAKKTYAETRDAGEALKKIHKNSSPSLESKLLAGLAKGHANDYVNALESIPRCTRLLYLHSFQSLVWNEMVSKRISLFGLQPVEGDLVIVEGCEDVEIEEKEEDETENGSEENIRKKKVVKALTKEDLSSYSIFDVVLPLPGYDVIYPENMKEHYNATLQKHGLTLEMAKQKVKTYNLSGDYRKAMNRVKDLSYKILLYNDSKDNLIRSDKEELKGEKEPESNSNGKYKALVLEFSLNSSSYATMVLREILKTDTSSRFHAQMTERNKIRKKHSKIKSEEVVIDQSDDLSCGSSLLNDQKKYDEFKNSIFNSIGIPVKRESDEGPDSKKPKLDIEPKEAVIEMEPSMV